MSQPNCSLCVGLGHGCLSLARATQQGQPQVLAHGAKARHGWEGYKEAVILPVLSVQLQQGPVIHEPHLKICAGFPRAGTPSSSEKEPMPQGSQESSQTSPRCSQHPKKKNLDSTKKSSGEGSHSKVHKKSKHPKEETPKKEKHHRRDKADKSKSNKSCKKLTTWMACF